ncbi:MAG: indolepyruvate oxidoreductase subunit beta [Desulforegulaceae bacterium]|jgi:indolepyruvate ferredoxin oxidoreductase beta subunit|nr:indolepyruvate oxidoreductase subunit beta [Desulforegulaceae bacterium]
MSNITKLIIVAVGGQGNLLASKILGEAALDAGIQVQMSEIHGMAQRGGVVESSILFGDAKSSIIADGEADILLGFEPLESLRAVAKCNKNTEIITNMRPLQPFTSAIGLAKYPESEEIEKLLKAKSKNFLGFDATKLAIEAGTSLSLNMVLLGALAQRNLIPIGKDLIEKTIKEKTKKQFAETNLKAFHAGFQKALELSK